VTGRADGITKTGFAWATSRPLSSGRRPPTRRAVTTGHVVSRLVTAAAPRRRHAISLPITSAPRCVSADQMFGRQFSGSAQVVQRGEDTSPQRRGCGWALRAGGLPV